MGKVSKFQNIFETGFILVFTGFTPIVSKFPKIYIIMRLILRLGEVTNVSDLKPGRNPAGFRWVFGDRNANGLGSFRRPDGTMGRLAAFVKSGKIFVGGQESD